MRVNYVIVKPLLDRDDDFVLEEDGDSGHGTGRTRNAVKKWKEDHRLEHYFNCASSPDLSPIENCWQPIKQHVRKYSHWDDANRAKPLSEWKSIPLVLTISMTHWAQCHHLPTIFDT